MITVSISGGLGNQMFQYAFGRAKAIKNNTEFVIVMSFDAKNTAERHFLLDNFNIKSKTVDSVSIKNRLFKIVEPHPPFSQKIYDIPKGYFVGNWQSEKYFKGYEKEIRSDFVLKKELSTKAKEIKNLIEKNNSVSIHVRRGDYASDEKVQKKHGLCSPEYYAKAISFVSEKINSPQFFVFSDDIAWVKENLSLPSSAVFVSGNGLSECEEMILMSQCKNNIIANSTFSWWGAWLNDNKNKIVIAPEKWFSTQNDTTYLIPSNWIQM